MKVLRRTKTAVLPERATEGAAAFDLTADSIDYSPDMMEAVIDTGLSVAVPDGHVLLIFSRSGQGFKSAIRLANCVGVIDSDYRGPLLVKLVADDKRGIDYLCQLQLGHRVAQAMVLKLPEVNIEEVSEVVFYTMQTARGDAGFGSTGK